MNKNSFFVIDFDGTIVNVWNRYYRVFLDASNTKRTIPIELYRELKRKYIRDNIVADMLEISLPENYYEEKKKLLEETRYLILDILIPDKKRIIDFILDNECLLLTKRNNPMEFFNEVDMLDLSLIKSKCEVLSPSSMSKFDYCKVHYPHRKVIVCGDSDEEYLFSEEPLNKVYVVNTGLRKSEDFRAKKNVFFINDINEFMALYEKGE